MKKLGQGNKIIKINERLKQLDKNYLNLKKMALEINQIENKISKNRRLFSNLCFFVLQSTSSD
ncbi:hypothetical protein [Spiroplasma endosymbiont of Danaus chrysippus]|uniref:hypothetical protein n=1 Tax=Spiroplasma endosymbiont of Danaus chrysippus TaxID=2691041 RepID=UPI00157B526E|nr:hypothetical protein [Spiroplasma endosymbiont of Danaus chrysippus]